MYNKLLSNYVILFLSFCRYSFVSLCLFSFIFSLWSFVDVPLIFFCPADHVRTGLATTYIVLLGMIEARSVKVKKTTTKTLFLDAFGLNCGMYYYLQCFCLLQFFWCPCMAINVSVQYNGGLLPDIILLTQFYYHRGTRLNAMKRFFCLCSR